MHAQVQVTIPWSSTLNQTFGNGSVNPGPLPIGQTDFTFTSNAVPAPGFYSVIYSTNDAGHVFLNSRPISLPTPGYKMIVCYDGSFTSKIVYTDTVRNLCASNRYLFWAGINNAAPGNCLSPNLTFSVETISGTVIADFQTGNIDKAGGKFADYYGYSDTKLPPVPFYGGIFQMPAGVSEIVVKVITNPSTAFPRCSAVFEIDNIILMPVGPELNISLPNGGFITASCFQGDIPIVLNGDVKQLYHEFGKPAYNGVSYPNQAFRWQKSSDDGYTWMDIPRETGKNIFHVFNTPDTFWIRLRGSDAADIANPNCSNVSNVIKVQVDGIPTNYTITSNSPVCTNGDIKINLSGGATYRTFGPNGFFDDSPFPHVYYPVLADSGWYRSEIISWGGCKTTDSVYVKVYGPNIAVSPDRLICYSDTVRLRATGGVKYEWTPAEGLSNSSIANPVASPQKTTRYEVLVSDNTDCTAYGHVTITLRNGPLKASIDGPDFSCPGDAILFKNMSMGKIIDWDWDFANGARSNMQNPAVQYYPADGAFYSVKLTVTDSSGCKQSAKKILKSADNCFIAVPNAFTPNNDGLNDFLYPLNAYKATHLVFKIFDRWGRLLFETRDWTKKWDGSFSGAPQASGVYVWMLSYTDADHKQVFLKGTAALIR